MSSIEVACGIAVRVFDEPRVLLTQRFPMSDYPYCWELPGGKVRSNELVLEGLKRELMEELRCGSDVIACKDTFEFTDVHGDVIRLAVFDVRLLGYSFADLKVFGAGWFSLKEIWGLKVTPGTNLALVEISKSLTGFRPPV